MKKIRIAIIGASEIAYRRFMPALSKDDRFEYVGVAIEREQDIEKADNFKRDYGGEIIQGYDNAILRNDVDAIYVPQPPALHYGFGKKVLTANKHLFMEKPFTISRTNTEELIKIAEQNNLAVVENYMFRFHKQIDEFIMLAKKDEIVGKVERFEVCFSFPQRATTDFRYNKSLGGGALFDCGGYTIMLSDILLDRKGHIKSFKPSVSSDFDVDIGGEGLMISDTYSCKFSFGMAHPYNCYAKAFGTKGVLVAPRVLTAPFDFDVKFDFLGLDGSLVKQIDVGCDDTFLKSIDNFYNCIVSKQNRENNYELIERQSKMIDEVLVLGGMK